MSKLAAVLTDRAQNFTSGEKAQARANIDVYSKDESAALSADKQDVIPDLETIRSNASAGAAAAQALPGKQDALTFTYVEGEA